MTSQRATCAAFIVFGGSLVATVLGQVLAYLSGHVPTQPEDIGLNPLDSFYALVFAGVGGLIASRQPRNPVGWCLSLVGLLASVGMSGFGYGYTYYSLGPGGPLPAAAWVTWATIVAQNIGVPTAALTFVLFPTGRPASRRWTTLMWLTIAATTINVVLVAIQPQALPGFRAIDNPLGLPADAPYAQVVAAYANTSDAFLPVVLLVGLASLVARFRAVRGEQRQQLKWVVFAVALLPVYFIGLIGLTIASFPDGPTACDVACAPAVATAWALWRVVVAAVPVSIGIAILRHRLFDIDLIIRRTLVYLALSIVLAVGYLATVVTLQEILRPITAGSDVAVVGSTLVMAAAFQPLRTRIQRSVERSFYRQRYDAARTVERFAALLAHEVDVESLGAELMGAVIQTIYPAHISLWLLPHESARERSQQ